MLWYFLQASIVFAVMAANIHWQITENPYLSAGAGFLAAYGTTGLINRMIDRGIGALAAGHADGTSGQETPLSRIHPNVAQHLTNAKPQRRALSI